MVKIGPDSRSLFILLGFCICLSACGGLINTADKQPEATSPGATVKPAPVKDLVYVVVPGDTLRGIAVQTTGTTQNWDIIAGYNKMAYPYALQIDQKIRIPGRLLLAKPAASVKRPTPVKRELKTPEKAPAVVKRDTGKPSAIASVGKRSEQVKDGPPAPVVEKKKAGSGWIMITGSYYPREVKLRPSGGADYLMLVRPGSRIRYIARQGDWYKVVTSRGEGYVQADHALEQ